MAPPNPLVNRNLTYIHIYIYGDLGSTPTALKQIQMRRSPMNVKGNVPGALNVALKQHMPPTDGHILPPKL